GPAARRVAGRVIARLVAEDEDDRLRQEPRRVREAEPPERASARVVHAAREAARAADELVEEHEAPAHEPPPHQPDARRAGPDRTPHGPAAHEVAEELERRVAREPGR